MQIVAAEVGISPLDVNPVKRLPQYLHIAVMLMAHQSIL